MVLSRCPALWYAPCFNVWVFSASINYVIMWYVKTSLLFHTSTPFLLGFQALKPLRYKCFNTTRAGEVKIQISRPKCTFTHVDKLYKTWVLSWLRRGLRILHAGQVLMAKFLKRSWSYYFLKMLKGQSWSSRLPLVYFFLTIESVKNNNQNII